MKRINFLFAVFVCLAMSGCTRKSRNADRKMVRAKESIGLAGRPGVALRGASPSDAKGAVKAHYILVVHSWCRSTRKAGGPLWAQRDRSAAVPGWWNR